jgi:hypothetical protein
MADPKLDPPEDENIATPPSDHHDSTYSEPPPVNLMITPEQRKRFAENFSEAAKKRVEKATNHFTKLRCLISNAPELYAVEYAHILPRATGPHVVSNQRLHLRFDSHICLFQLQKLEYSWGMRFGTFNVDSRYNIIRREPFRYLFLQTH